MSATAPQRKGHLRRSALAVLTAATVVALASVTLPASEPAAPPDSGAAAPTPPPELATTPDPTAGALTPSPTTVTSAAATAATGSPPNLANPATPLPTGLPADEPVRLVVEGVASDALAALEPTVAVALERDGLNAVTLPADALGATVDDLRTAGATRVEVDALVAPHASVTPTDPFWAQWWGARQFGLEGAWGTTQGNAETVIAIIDSGVSELSELSGRVLPGTTYLGTGADPRVDLDGHGTSSAIVAAGAINNGVAAGGSCPQCLVLPVQVVDPETGLAYLSDVAAGIRWATDNGADVISISLGGPSTISTLATAVTYANSRGVPVIASAGNDGDEVVNYPAGLTNVIGVAALGSDGALASWSTRGAWVTTAVAGCNITQRASDGGVIWFCGTSSAAPLLAGAVALLDSRFPDSTVDALTSRVEQASTPGVLTAHGSASAATLVTTSVPPGVTAPDAPSITALDPGPGQLNVTFAAPPSNGGSAVTRYEVSVNDGAFSEVALPDPGVATGTFTLDQLVNGTAYRVRLRAVNVAGAGAASAEAVATPRTVPGTITSPAAVAAGSSAVRVTWALPATGGAPLTAVQVQWALTEDLESAGITLDLLPSATTALIDELEPATAVFVRVRARNVAGWGAWSAPATATTDAGGGTNVVNPPPDPTPVPLAPTPFIDVPVGTWFDTPTRWAFTIGVTNGTSPTAFSPRGVITRAQWLTMLWRLAGAPEPGAPSGFVDVSPLAYYADATAWAAETGVTEGVDGGSRFEPLRPITRAEAVTMLWRLAGEPQPSAPSSFPDVATDRYFTLAVAWARETGLTTGVGNTGTFAPAAGSTRAEAVTLLWRRAGSPTSLVPA